jgi:biopolymer transport protein ExbD
MARKRRRDAEEVAAEETNMTPMIDVVFQLLIFFMLTMHFKEVEGKLLSQLPKDKGLAPTHVLQPELQEVRIVVCAGGDTRLHKHDKGKHEKADKNNEICKTMVEQNEIGDLYKTEKFKDKAGANKGVYASIASRTKELVDAQPSTKDATRKAPVILDACSEVPYEHIIGVVDSCKAVGIDNIEFVGNPRHDKYYGSFQKGQFERNKK